MRRTAGQPYSRALNPALMLALLALIATPTAGANGGAIQPWPENPRYWEFQGEPTLLLGGFETASPHAWEPERFIEQLDVLVESGGNYLRCITYARDHWHPDLPTPWRQLDDGRFDLDAWNPIYWERLEGVLEASAERGVVVQIEFWDGQNFQRRWEGEESRERWRRNPMNPENNVNYAAEETTLPANWEPSFENEPHPALLTVPTLNDDPTALVYQERFVREVLDRALDYGNVLFVPKNESWAPQEWSNHWAEFTRRVAAERGRTAYVGDMRFTPDADPVTEHGFDFAELSQSASGASRPSGSDVGQGHFDAIAAEMAKLDSRPAPANSVKQYAAGDEGVERVWRTVFAGQASARFHRPDWGLGLNARAQANIRSLRAVTDAIGVFNVQPHQEAGELLRDREENEAYVMADPGRVYAVFFTGGGEAVELDVSAMEGDVLVRWIDPNTGEWMDGEETHAGPAASLAKPSDGQWVAVVTPTKSGSSR